MNFITFAIPFQGLLGLEFFPALGNLSIATTELPHSEIAMIQVL